MAMFNVKPKRYKGNFTSFSNSFIRDTEMSDGAFRLLVFLLSQSNEFSPSESALAKRLGVSLRTVANRVKELKERGFLRIEVFRVTGCKVESKWIVSEHPNLKFDEDKPP